MSGVGWWCVKCGVNAGLMRRRCGPECGVDGVWEWRLWRRCVSGAARAQVFRVPFASTVWAVQLSLMPEGPKLIVGGEMPTLSVIDVNSRQPQVALPVMRSSFIMTSNQFM